MFELSVLGKSSFMAKDNAKTVVFTTAGGSLLS